MKLTVVIVSLYCGAIHTASAGRLTSYTITGCTADANDRNFPKPDPLFLRPGVNYINVTEYEDAFILPDQYSGLLTFQQGESVRIACPGSTIAALGTQEITVTCDSSNVFKLPNASLTTIEQLSCKSPAKDVAARKDTCVNGATGINLGFQLGSDIFPLVYSCFNERTQETYYSMERVPAELVGYDSGESSPSFRKDDFYGSLNVDSSYTYDNQIAVFTKLLGSAVLAKQYIRDRSKYFLARGHLAPRADFVLGAHTRVTYHFVNVAAQWQIFNGGVWEYLENSVRDYAIHQGTDLIVYTGPWGTLQYPDIDGKLIDIYLANPGTANQTLKVPKFYWKIAYDPATKRGVAFVGINDPYVNVPRPDDYILCNDIINNVKWLKAKDSLKLLYACDVQELAANSEIFPKLDVSGGLLT